MKNEIIKALESGKQVALYDREWYIGLLSENILKQKVISISEHSLMLDGLIINYDSYKILDM